MGENLVWDDNALSQEPQHDFQDDTDLDTLESGPVVKKELPYIKHLLFDIWGSVIESNPIVERKRLNMIWKSFNPQKLTKEQIENHIETAIGLSKMISEKGCLINPYRILFHLLGTEGMPEKAFNVLIDKDDYTWLNTRPKLYSNFLIKLIKNCLIEGYRVGFIHSANFESIKSVQSFIEKEIGSEIDFFDPVVSLTEIINYYNAPASEFLMIGNNHQKHFIEPLSIGMNTALVNNPKTKHKSNDFMRQLEINNIII
jgi:hypothetical protein